MVEFKLAKLQAVSAHFVGNSAAGEGTRLSDKSLWMEDREVEELLKKFFLAHFTTPEYYTFHFPGGDLSLNPVMSLCKSVFADPGELHRHSRSLAAHLYDCSSHPNTKAGELYVAYFGNLVIGNVPYDAIGLFRSENKESFLRLVTDGKEYSMIAELGISADKPDRGCLVLKTNEENGYKVLATDRNRDVQFWKDDFLKIKPLADNYYFTQNLLTVTKNYVTQQLNSEFEVSRAEQIDLLNKSVEYFKTAEKYNEEEFARTVFNDEEVISSFRQFRDESLEDEDIAVPGEFDISSQAVKKQSRIFKSVLKLDRNFHIYIHGNKDLIEKGTDENGRKYYKIYYTEES